jgi:hypothetical protein
MDPFLLDVDQIPGGCSECELGERDEPEALGLGNGTLGVAVGGTAAERLSRGSGNATGDGGSESDGDHFDIRVLRVGLRRECRLFPPPDLSHLRDQACLAPRALLLIPKFVISSDFRSDADCFQLRQVLRVCRFSLESRIRILNSTVPCSPRFRPGLVPQGTQALKSQSSQAQHYR